MICRNKGIMWQSKSEFITHVWRSVLMLGVASLASSEYYMCHPLVYGSSLVTLPYFSYSTLHITSIEIYYMGLIDENYIRYILKLSDNLMFYLNFIFTTLYILCISRWYITPGTFRTIKFIFCSWNIYKSNKNHNIYLSLIQHTFSIVQTL